MINVRITGGLGNQIFQFGAAIVLSRRFNLPIRLWVGALRNYATPRDFVLPHLVDLPKFATSVRRHPNWVQRTRLARIAPCVLGQTAWISDTNLLAVARQVKPVRSIQLDGYFIESIDQSFFNETLDLLRPAVITNSQTVKPDRRVCAIHIRGGDFLKLGMTLEGELHYYRTSLDQVRELDSEVRVVAVTDDRTHAEEVLRDIGESVEIASGGLLSDFDLLGTADFAILSNSTFSFWARAWSSRKIEGWSTLAPRFWRPGVPRLIRLDSEATSP